MSDKNTPEAGRAVVLTLHGEPYQAPRLPAGFTAARSRSAERADQHDQFLPPGFLIPRQTIALDRRVSRQRGDPVRPAPEVALQVGPDELVIIELADGGLIITRGERLQHRHLSDAPLAGGASRGVLGDWAGELISRVYTIGLGALPENDPVVEDLGGQVEDWLIDKAAAPLARKGVAGVVWAIERRLTGLCGLRRWHRDGLRNWSGEGVERGQQPMLVFVHDLASDTLASFGALQGSETLGALERQFPGGVYGFEHRTLSCSPVVNAIELVKALPPQAQVSLVTLGRGGLVGDLLCVSDFASASQYLPEAQRTELNQLAALLQDRQTVVQRYLRVASPSDGTALLGESLDLFLSGVLSVVGLAAKADPLAETVYSAFQRIVLEMVRLRADASAIPGLADLMPDAPLGRFLREAPVRKGLQMAVLAGDTDGAGGWLRRIGLWVLDKALMGSPYHDLMVDTPSMLAGIAQQAGARARLDARPEVSHFRYFQHAPHVRALRDWLCEKDVGALPGFDALEAVREQLQPPDDPAVARSLSGDRSIRPGASPAKPAKATRTTRRPRSTLRRTLTVSVHAADLRFLPGVLMVGHYEQDPIAGPQAVVDRELLDGMLSQRHSLGLYPGAIGTALAVLPAGGQTQRGAVVVGLGRFEEPLTRDGLTEAVMAGVLRYLLQVGDCQGSASCGLDLNTLLIGTNSASSLSVGASVEALVRGVLEANARFHDTTGRDLRVERLRIVELYLDTAITATYALNASDRQQTLRTVAAMLDTHLESVATLQQQDGARPRLFDGAAAGGNYWPRLMVTDARRGEDGAETAGPLTPMQPAAVATQLRYLHLGQRARVETVVQQRQPGLVEQLVRQQIRDKCWTPEAGRALFHLMVPHVLKDTLRHFGRLVVVVDAQTANMPWELVVADDPGRADVAPQALALRIPLVRQLVTAEYRPQLRQATNRAALVIGNPSLERFDEHFVNEKGEPLKAPDPLPGAGEEARAVAAVLRAQGHDVTLLADEPPVAAAEVVMALYRQPWRILHVCAHGVFAQRSVDEVALTGVLLSDGAVISATEIAAMEMVPELVFLNCCHLGQMTAPARAGSVQRLAASLARELIGVGVRCVVVAGWAVGDWPAQRFGEVFYETLLGPQGLDFGHAVLAARKEAAAVAQDLTWGAYQAYGDPGWRAHRPSDAAGRGSAEAFVSPDELLDKLAQLRVVVTQREKRSQPEHETPVDPTQAVPALLDRCAPDWLTLPQVQSALGGTWFALSDFERAETAFRAALRSEQETGVVPVRHIELLANALTRRAPLLADAGDGIGAQTLLDEALGLLDRLDQMAFAGQGSTSERGALKGSALKRRAEWLLGHSPVDPQAVREAVSAAALAYEQAGDKPYPCLNALVLRALLCAESERSALVRRARDCGKVVREATRDAPSDSWNAVMVPEALMVELLLTGPERAPALERRVHAAYQKLLHEALLKPVQRKSMRTHLALLTRLAGALGRTELVTRLERLRPVLQ